MAKSADKTGSESQSAKGAAAEQPSRAPASQLAAGLIFGIVFGFLLQKGGVAKFHILEGQLILADFTVVKVMLSAIVVGMAGVHLLHRAGIVELHIKPTRLLANSLGGLIFGVGFGLAAYCPGTGAAAIGQGNFDGLLMVAGMIAGSWLFAENSAWMKKHVEPVADLGKTTIGDWFNASRTNVALAGSAMLAAVVIAIDWLLS
jgi:uncharacterized membrane protein YedE/YeeE